MTPNVTSNLPPVHSLTWRAVCNTSRSSVPTRIGCFPAAAFNRWTSLPSRQSAQYAFETVEFLENRLGCGNSPGFICRPYGEPKLGPHRRECPFDEAAARGTGSLAASCRTEGNQQQADGCDYGSERRSHERWRRAYHGEICFEGLPRSPPKLGGVPSAARRGGSKTKP